MSVREPLVALRRVGKSWVAGRRRLPVLRDVSVEVAEGESLAIVGPSGAGKSTLLHVMALLTPVDEGEVLLAGRPLGPHSWWDPGLRRGIGIVFQDAKLLPGLRVIDNVCMPLVHRGMWPARQRRRALEVLEAVGLADHQRHFPNQLSAGELMRVAIARALVIAPRLILADEPTGTLDSVTGEMIARLLLGLVTPERALVIVTHHPPLAERCTRTISMKDGRVEDA